MPVCKIDYNDLYQLQQTKKILRGQKKNLLNQPYASCDLHPLVTFLPVLITDFFQSKVTLVLTMHSSFSPCKNKAWHSGHRGRLSGGVFAIFIELEKCLGISRFTENVYLSH